MTIEQILREAIQGEADAYELYTGAVELVRAEHIKELLGELAQEELGHKVALEKMLAAIFSDADLEAFLAKRRLSTEGLLGLRLSKLAAELYGNTWETLTPKEGSCTMALAALKGDDEHTVGSQLLPELQKLFRPPVFRFYTRTQLDEVLKEQSLQMSDLVDEVTTVEYGKLKGVDYLVTGTLSREDNALLLQVQINNVTDGEVVGSAGVRVAKTP